MPYRHRLLLAVCLLGWLSAVPATSLCAQFDYTYDANGRLVRISSQFDESAFQYDQTNNLIAAAHQFSDGDDDGLPDFWEDQFGLDPSDPADAPADNDGDGLSNLEEYQAGTDPTMQDTDGDGFTDAEEIAAGTDPLDPASKPGSVHPVPGISSFGIILAGLLVLGLGFLTLRGPKPRSGPGLLIPLLLTLAFLFTITQRALAEPPAVSVVFAMDSWSTGTEYAKGRDGVIQAVNSIAAATQSVEMSFLQFCRWDDNLIVEREIITPATLDGIITGISRQKWPCSTYSLHHAALIKSGDILDLSAAPLQIIFLVTINYRYNGLYEYDFNRFVDITARKQWTKEERDRLQAEGVIIAPVLVTENDIARFYLESWGFGPPGIATYGVPYTATSQEIGDYIYEVIMAAVAQSPLTGSRGKQVTPKTNKGGVR